MFTGIIDSKGTVTHARKTAQSLMLAVAPDISPYDAKPGDSIAVNGACLTMESVENNILFFTAVSETLEKTTLAHASSGLRVNLERALRPSDRLGGHIVLGHVDGVGRIVRDRSQGKSVIRTVWIPQPLRIFMAVKGSVALDGVSLTIADCGEETIDVSLIPYTLSATIAGDARPGDNVNIECDVFARYIYAILKHEGKSIGRHNRPADETLLAKMENGGF